MSGLLHLVIGFLAVRLAVGDRTADVDQSAALRAMGGGPLGAALLVTTAVGLGLLGVWQAATVFVRRETKDRLKSVGKAVGYLALAATAVGVLRGVGRSGEESSQEATATVLSLPGGTALLVAVGLAILGIGGYHIVKGARRSFRRDLTEEPPQGIVGLGIIGYVAKGLALVAVGVLFVQAGVSDDAQRAGGLDGGLTALLGLPLGAVLVGLVGAGFAAFGVYSFARARWART